MWGTRAEREAEGLRRELGLGALGREQTVGWELE